MDNFLYYIREFLCLLIIKLLIPKNRNVVVSEPNEKLITYKPDKEKVYIYNKENQITEYKSDQKTIITDIGQEVLLPGESEIGLLIPKPYHIDSTSLMHVEEVKSIVNKWAKKNNKNIEWKVGPRDAYLATYSEADIKEVMGLMPEVYFNSYKTPVGLEFSDCDDYAGVHFQYWIKRILPGCAYVIMEGYKPDGHEFGCIITNKGKIIWINVQNPEKYEILAVVRY